MAKIRLISDTHIGLSRQSHTTPASSERLRKALWGAAIDATRGYDEVIHLGDLFDKYTNPESVIADGARLLEGCSVVLAGNHDMANREGCLSSLQLLNQTVPGAVFEPKTFFSKDRNVEFYAIPHCLTQAKFEEALDTAQILRKTGLFVLLLHCNYDNPRAAEASEASLNLTRGMAGRLLESFDYILIGHEHVARSDFDGRLRILGSLHPTSFADISDKYAWVLDTETMRLERSCTWSHERYMQVDWREAGTTAECRSAGLDFIDITGTATPAEMREVATKIQQAWKHNPSLYMVRNSVMVEGAGEAAVSEAHKALNVTDRIRAELKGTAMGELFEHYAGRL